MGEDMIRKWKTALIGLLVVIFVLGDVYFVNKSRENGYSIRIGAPVMGEGDFATSGVDLTNAKALKQSTDINTVFFSLILANSVAQPEITKSLPDAEIWICDLAHDLTYFTVPLWLTEESIVFKFDGQGSPMYKEISDVYYVEGLRQLVNTNSSLKR